MSPLLVARAPEGGVRPQPFFRLLSITIGYGKRNGALWLLFSFLSSNYGATTVVKVSQLST